MLKKLLYYIYCQSNSQSPTDLESTQSDSQSPTDSESTQSQNIGNARTKCQYVVVLLTAIQSYTVTHARDANT